MRLRVLVIDDDEAVREGVRAGLESAAEESPEQEWEVFDHGFEGVGETLRAVRPDVVILDLVDGEPPDDQPRGNARFREIRDTWFCPVVVYSAFPDRQDFGHPLVHTVVKAADAMEKVLIRLDQLAPMARAIRSVHDDFDARIREALRDSVDALRGQTDSGAESDDELQRAVRRQVAARVDLAASAGKMLLAWERFVIPPLGSDLLTADLLKEHGADWTDANAFRLVLTPSCDMVRSGGRAPKAERILVARCEPLRKLGQVELEPGSPLSNPKKKRIRTFLTEGMDARRVVIPRFKGHVPLMVADLKRLELMDWAEISARSNGDAPSTGSAGFERAASTDSPFRELVTWAYLRVTGRPGMPDVDIEKWTDDISASLAANGSQ